MPKGNEELINRLLREMDEQREVIRQGKDARRIIKELNRLIATLGGQVPDDEVEDEEPSPSKQSRHPRAKGDYVLAPNADGSYTCPECGRDGFARPQGIAAHRRAQHGVAGSLHGR